MVLFRSETVCFLIPKRWALLSPEMKNIISSAEFKKKNTRMDSKQFSMLVIQICIQNNGFI